MEMLNFFDVVTGKITPASAWHRKIIFIPLDNAIFLNRLSIQLFTAQSGGEETCSLNLILFFIFLLEKWYIGNHYANH